MNRLRVLSLTTLMVVLASRLPGQTPANGEDLDGQIVACNDGTITFNVARAYRELGFFGNSYQWQFEGWYNVDPGKCADIGPSVPYHNSGLFSKDSVTLLAFAFTDFTGTWGSISPAPYGDDRQWYPSNQKFCIQHEVFKYHRDSPNGDLPRACDGAQAGYQMIPASYEYSGPLGLSRLGYDSRNAFHVNIAANARAIPLGPQTSISGSSQRPGGAASSQSNGDASPSMCGKVSCWDLFLQGLNQAAKDKEAQKAAANVNHNPPPPQPTVAPRSVVSPAPAPSALPQRPRLAPIMLGRIDVSHLGGLQRGDAPEYVFSLFGPPTGHSEQDSSAFGGYPHTRSDGLSVRVNYDHDGLRLLKIYGRGTRSRADPLLNLFAKSESDALALLGTPKKREYAETIDDIYLIWSFPVDGRPADQRPLPQSAQTLTLHFTTGVGCNSITLIW